MHPLRKGIIETTLVAIALTSGAVIAAETKSHEDRVESRITRLHSELNITPAQETQWVQVTEVMRENARNTDAMSKSRADKAASMSAVDDLKSYEEITRAHADGIRQFTSAFEPLYAGMTDAQRREADELFRHGTSPKSKKTHVGDAR